MKTLPLVLSAFSLSFAFAESPREPENLVSLSAFENAEDWAMAKQIEGSTSEKKWAHIEGEGAILYNGAEGKANNIVSKSSHGDVSIDVEFMIPKSSNSGLYLMQRYEVQILDSYGKPDKALSHGDGGGIYQRWDDTQPKGKEGFEGTPPSTNASSAPGTWQSYRILFRAPRFDGEGKKLENARFIRVEHNGVVIHEDVEVTGPTRGGKGGAEEKLSPLMIQGDHGPIAIRKLQVKHTKFH